MDGKNAQTNGLLKFYGKRVLKAKPGDYTSPPPVAIIDCEKMIVEKTRVFKYKQAIVLRKDIKMSPGKAIVQGAHVSVLAAVATIQKYPEIYAAWTSEGHAKISLRVDSLDELIAIKKKADIACLQTSIIADFGLTELEAGTVTAIAIGPAPAESIDDITKGLKLY